VLAVSAALDLSGHGKTLDPPPLQKWAEEGYAVAQILVGDSAMNIVGQLGTAIAELEKLPECSGDKFGLVGMAPFKFRLRVVPRGCADDIKPSDTWREHI
jgi:carboxymethylenebutenolidase